MAAKGLMIQGTSSDAGKSLLAAGLCRVFARRGLRVAPFKSQNMALNSFVTADGLEMGRAQVMQSECAGIAPDVRMNPVLLKPTGERRSQVIVLGEPVGEMDARAYYAYKRELVPVVAEAYRSLARECDVVILEGAGSPAEINLRENDIVNMGMAKLAGAPVLLVGDIDRGGVFAALAGTRLLLEPPEQDMLKGVIINKFRGDKALLTPGLERLEELMHCPVAGVVPMLELDVDDEDSLSTRLEGGAGSGLDIAVIRLPRLSNFTDFAPLARIPGAGVRYVSAPRQLGAPDLLILPGTKSTMADLAWLRSTGLADGVLEAAARGTPVFGVCGGYQMLGESLRDPQGTELGGELPGLGLLPHHTVFAPQKLRRQVRGRFRAAEGPLAALSGADFTGYEIHTGSSGGPGGAMMDIDGEEGPRPEGRCRGNVYGTYVHGVFDSGEVLDAVARALYQARGMACPPLDRADAARHKEREYDKLADALEEALDMALIEQILEKGV